MNLAILQTGHNNPALPDTLRAYPQMFTELLGPLAENGDVQFTTYPVVDGQFPADIHDHDGYIITGSRHGVKVNVVKTTNYMQEGSDTIDLIYVHQDQVLDLPTNAVHLAGDEFCPNAAYAIGDTVFSVQGHPEFDKGYVHELLAIRGEDMGDDVCKTASASLAGDHEGIRVGKWIMAFFAQALAKTKSAH